MLQRIEGTSLIYLIVLSIPTAPLFCIADDSRDGLGSRRFAKAFGCPKICHVSVGQVTTGNLIPGCFAARTAKPLGIFFGCIEFFLRVTVSALDSGLKPLLPVAQSRSPFLGKEGDQLIH